MKNIWVRLAICYSFLFLGVSTLCGIFLHQFLLNKVSISDQQIVRLEALYALMMIAVFVVASYVVARFLIKPLVALSNQLDLIDINNINRKVFLSEQGPEMKRLIDQINDLLSQIHIGLTQLNQYSAQVAHELRTPLTVVRLKIEQAVDKIDPQLAEDIQNELLRLTMHLERTLLIARAEQGHLPLHRSDFDLKKILDEIVEGFRLLAAEEKREIHVSSDNTVIRADPAYSKQILYNLLSNALRHGQGAITIRLKTTKLGAGLLVINQLKTLSPRPYNLGLGKRIVEALASVHGNMRVRHKKWRNHYSAELLVTTAGFHSV